MGGLFKKFEDKVNSATKSSEATAKGMVNTGQVAWDTLADTGVNEPGPERFLTSFRAEFERDSLGKEYIDANSKVSTGVRDVKSKVSELMLIRLQYDWLMQVERDYLLRKRSRLRIESHSAAVREMCGDPKGPFQLGPMRLAKQRLALSAENEVNG